MNPKDKALNYAIRCLKEHNQTESSNLDEILHIMLVGDLLCSYAFEDEVVAAGYLHSLPELTTITTKEISVEFPGSISGLVGTARTPDASMSAKERKKAKVRTINDLSIDNVAVILADTLAHIEKIYLELQEKINAGLAPEDFVKYGGFDYLKSYYEEVFAAILKNYKDKMIRESYRNSKIEQLLDRLDANIQALFNNDDLANSYLQTTIFKEWPDNNLLRSKSDIQLSSKQNELLQMRNVAQSDRPFIIQFTASPKEKFVTMSDFINAFLEGDSFKVAVVTQESDDLESGITLMERNLLLAAGLEDQLLRDAAGERDIFLVESGLFDRLMQIKELYKGEDQARINSYLKNYGSLLDIIINGAALTYANPQSLTTSGDIRNVVDYDQAKKIIHQLLAGQSMLNGLAGSNSKTIEFKELSASMPAMHETTIHQLTKYFNQ